MFEKIKTGIAGNMLARYIRKKDNSEMNFSSFISDSRSVMILMPADESDFPRALEVVDYLSNKDKTVYVFLPEHKLNLLNKSNIRSITFTENDFSKFGLPDKELKQKLQNKHFDIVIDLNRQDNLFYSAASNYLETKIRVGFKKNMSDLYYNFQVPGRINNENSYRNLLNSFNMF